MKKGLTQGGTSSPALFKMYINDLPEHIRGAMREQGKDTSDLDPIRLVADDVVCPAKEVDSLQIALDTCFEWAKKNRLQWNPEKSQILAVHPEGEVPSGVHLGGVELKWATQVEYLGLRLTRDGFLGKEPKEVETKARNALHMLTNEQWFDLNLEPKYITREFLTHVRSTMLYGAELLTSSAREPFIQIDEKLTNLLLTKLLKLGSTKLAKKHQLRVQLALGIPTFVMDVEKNIHGRIQSWLEKRTSTVTQIADRASDSLQDITKLDDDHPMRVALKSYTPHTNRVVAYRLQDWSKLEAESRGANPNNINRQFKASVATSELKKRSLIEEPQLNGELRKAALQWSIYRFPVKHTATAHQNRLLEMMPRWTELDDAQKTDVKTNLFEVYNDEERAWNRAPLPTPSRPDIRSRTNARSQAN